MCRATEEDQRPKKGRKSKRRSGWFGDGSLWQVWTKHVQSVNTYSVRLSPWCWPESVSDASSTKLEVNSACVDRFRNMPEHAPRPLEALYSDGFNPISGAQCTVKASKGWCWSATMCISPMFACSSTDSWRRRLLSHTYKAFRCRSTGMFFLLCYRAGDWRKCINGLSTRIS